MQFQSPLFPLAVTRWRRCHRLNESTFHWSSQSDLARLSVFVRGDLTADVVVRMRVCVIKMGVLSSHRELHRWECLILKFIWKLFTGGEKGIVADS